MGTPRQNAQGAAAKSARRRATGSDYDYDRSVKFANRGCLLIIAGTLLIIAITLLVVYLNVVGEINGRKATATGTVTVQIPAGSGGQTVSKILMDAGLISNDGIFRFYVRFNGAGSGFQKGDFELEPGMSYQEMIDILTEPPPARELLWVTFPPGGTVIQFAQAAEDAGLCSAADFLDAAANDDFSDIEFMKYIDEDDNTFQRLEGYLAPDSYEFYSDDTAHNVVRKLLNQFNKNLGTIDFDGKTAYDLIDAQREKMPEGSEWGLRQVVTLASLIEEEASIADENQTGVALAFWNRLANSLAGTGLARRTMGSDVTLRYLTDWVARDYGGAIDVSQMSQPEMKQAALAKIPQNVFYSYYTGDDDELTHEGLPVSPVSNPGTTALVAALTVEMYMTQQLSLPQGLPQDIRSCYFFLAFPDGEFAYARTYNQHLGNVERLRQAVAAAGQDG